MIILSSESDPFDRRGVARCVHWLRLIEPRKEISSMPLGIIKSGRARRERLIGAYMQQIRDIRKACLDRRALLRLGLVMSGGGLAAVRGLRDFAPYRAYADDGGGALLISPPNTPFQDPLPIPPVVGTTTLNPVPTKGPNPARSPLTGFTEARTEDHQFFDQFPPQQEHEYVEREIQHQFFPVIDGVPTSPVWTFVDATRNDVVPPLGLRVNASYGVPLVIRIHNALPAENHGFGINQTTTHLHNGHTASESDGGPVRFFDAGHFFDYHYLNVRAGFASNVLTSALNGHTVQGDVHETMSFLWFHDHRFGFTSQNVHKGLVGFYTLFSADVALDTGDETTGLRLPSGDFDIPMVLIDRTFDPTTGQLFFDLFNLDGVLGDRFTVNNKIQPFLEVKRRTYRFRILNGSPSRVYELFLSNGQQFIQISSDGNLLPAPVPRTSIRLGVAERVDVIVDFTNVTAPIRLQNRLVQDNGRGPTGKIVAPGDELVEFRPVGDAIPGPPVPVTLLALPSTNVPIARRRSWEFDRSGGAWVVNDRPFDPTAIRANIKQNTAETWSLKSGGGWMHPVHIHLEEHRVQSVDSFNRVPADDAGRKDTVRIGENAVGAQDVEGVSLFMQFRDFVGDYPIHCHNTVHEDHAMMALFQVEP
jgi:FtsP/CotA-like multicopper oxidase with cupredoxin domain